MKGGEGGKGRMAPRSAGKRTRSDFPSKPFKNKEIVGVCRIFPWYTLSNLHPATRLVFHPFFITLKPTPQDEATVFCVTGGHRG